MFLSLIKKKFHLTERLRAIQKLLTKKTYFWDPPPPLCHHLLLFSLTPPTMLLPKTLQTFLDKL